MWYAWDYNLSRKAEPNLQKNSDSLITKARAKQLQSAFTSQIGMIEAVSELKLAICSELVQRFLFVYN
jgi:hypothetical protein